MPCGGVSSGRRAVYSTVLPSHGPGRMPVSSNGKALLDPREIAVLVAGTPRVASAGRESKVRPLKKLTVKHRRIVALYLGGHTNAEIAATLEIHPGTVYAVLSNPTTKGILEDAYKDHLQDLRALVPNSIGAIRGAMDDPDPRIQLAGVDRLYKGLDVMRPQDEREGTAEDVVRRIIHIRSEGKTEVMIAEETKKIPTGAMTPRGI